VVEGLRAKNPSGLLDCYFGLNNVDIPAAAIYKIVAIYKIKMPL
jgi:hypothetical protein